jgi:hypothetical protein
VDRIYGLLHKKGKKWASLADNGFLEVRRIKEKMGDGRCPLYKKSGKCHPHTSEMPGNENMEVSVPDC